MSGPAPAGPGRIQEVAAVILAGGRSSRMGRDKALIELAGAPLVVHSIRAAAEVFERVFISGPEDLARFGCPVLADQYQGLGPLSGVFSGLKGSGSPWVFTLPCDSPFVPPAFLRGMASLINDHDVIVPRVGGFYEPTHSIYSRRCLGPVEALLGSGEGKILRLYDSVRVEVVGDDLVDSWDPEGLAFFNVNTGEDLVRARSIFSSRLGR